VSLLAALALSVGCGARGPEPGPGAPRSAPQSLDAAPSGEPGRGAPAESAAPAPRPTAPAGEEEKSADQGASSLEDEAARTSPRPAGALAEALAAFGASEALLATELARAAAGPRCDHACHALRSLERSADRICELDGDGPRCRAARDRVADARSRVRAACGACS